MTEIHDDPLREAAAAIVGLGNELANVVMATQSLQLRLIGLKPDKDAPLEDESLDEPEVSLPELRSQQAAARFGWQPALNDEWLADATPVEAARAWAAAVPFAEQEPSAALAMARAEARLEEIHPEAMAEYRGLRSAGRDPAAAMLEAAPAFEQPTTSRYAREMLATNPDVFSRPEPITPLHRDVGLDDGLHLTAHQVPYHSAGVSERYDEALGESQQATTGVPSRATASPLTTTHQGIVEADDVPELFDDLDEQPDLVRAGAASEALESRAQEELGMAQSAFAQPDIAATPTVDEQTLGQDVGARHQAAADNLHAAAATEPLSEAAQAAQTAMRNFPSAHEAVDRIPSARAPMSQPSKRKSLGKVLGRGRRR